MSDYTLKFTFIGVTQSLDQAISNVQQKLGSVTNSTQNFQQTMTQTGTAITSLGSALSPVKDAFAGMIETTAELDSTMSKVQAISGATAEEYEILRDKAREMGAQTKFTAAESAEAMTYMAMAGWKTDEMLSGVSGIMNLAAASGENLATTSDIVTDALTAFGMKAEESGHFADILAAASSNANTNVSMMGESFKYVAPVAGTLGYSAEDVSVALGLMANSGIKASQAGTSLRTMLTNMANPTDTMSAAMEKLGISLDDGEGHMYSFREVMDQLREGFGDLKIDQDDLNEYIARYSELLDAGLVTQEDYDEAISEYARQCYSAEEAIKAQTAAELAGKNGLAGLLTLVSASDEDYEKLINAVDGCSDSFVKTTDGSIIPMSQALEESIDWVEEYDGAAEQMASTMQDNLNGQMQTLQSQLDELAIGLADTLIPAIRDIIDKVQQLVDWFNGLDDSQKELIATVGAAIAIVAVVSSVLGPLMITLSVLGGTMGLVVAAIAAVIAIGILLYNHWDEIKEAAQNLLDKIKEIFEKIKDKIVETWENIADTVTGLVDGIVEGISTAWNTVKDTVTEVGGKIKDAASDTWEEVKDEAQRKWDLMADAYEEHGGGLEGATAATMALIEDHFTKTFDAINEITDGKFGDAVQGVKDLIDGAKEHIENALDKIKNLFNFEWKFPDIKLPHFSISGSFSLSPPSVPSLGVDWYAKAMDRGMILNGATAFGINSSGQLMAGGEAGSETIVGTGSLMGMVGRAAVRAVDSVSGDETDPERIYAAVKEGASDASVTLQIGDRTFRRYLMDMGVQFA